MVITASFQRASTRFFFSAIYSIFSFPPTQEGKYMLPLCFSGIFLAKGTGKPKSVHMSRPMAISSQGALIVTALYGSHAAFTGKSYLYLVFSTSSSRVIISPKMSTRKIFQKILEAITDASKRQKLHEETMRKKADDSLKSSNANWQRYFKEQPEQRILSYIKALLGMGAIGVPLYIAYMPSARDKDLLAMGAIGVPLYIAYMPSAPDKDLFLMDSSVYESFVDGYRPYTRIDDGYRPQPPTDDLLTVLNWVSA